MNNIAVLILSLLSFVFCTACKKTVFKRNLLISVTDKVYNKPIKNCRVFISQENKERPLHVTAPLTYKYFKYEGITDNNGKTECEFKPYKNKKASTIRILAFLNEFNGDPSVLLKIYEAEIEENNLKMGDNEIEIKAPPVGYLKIYLKNTEPYNENDLFSIKFPENYGDYSTYFIGNNIDKSFLFPLYGDKTIAIYCESKKNNIKNLWQYQIYCPANDTTSLDINY